MAVFDHINGRRGNYSYPSRSDVWLFKAIFTANRRKEIIIYTVTRVCGYCQQHCQPIGVEEIGVDRFFVCVAIFSQPRGEERILIGAVF